MERDITGDEAPDVAAKRTRTRRKLLAGTGVALGIAAAETIAHAGTARAASGDPMIVGESNTATTETTISTTSSSAISLALSAANANALFATNNDTTPTVNAINFGSGSAVSGTGGTGIGVVGTSDSFWGVYANTTSGTGLQAGSKSGVGVVGTSSTATGIYGQTGNTDGYALTHDGVRGFTDSAAGSGVRGENAGSGVGVTGVAKSRSGVGVRAQNTGGGTALQVSGPSVFNRSGKVSMASSHSSATVSVPGGLSASALVLAVLQNAISGVYVTAAVPNTSTGKVTIFLNKAPGSTAHVAWFVVN